MVLDDTNKWVTLKTDHVCVIKTEQNDLCQSVEKTKTLIPKS